MGTREKEVVLVKVWRAQANTGSGEIEGGEQQLNRRIQEEWGFLLLYWRWACAKRTAVETEMKRERTGGDPVSAMHDRAAEQGSVRPSASDDRSR
eukprot:364487-Chlamydomonas_euryale.AAC.32